MFNLGFSELIVLGIIALVFIGPKQLPEVARVVGRLINEWKRATNDFTSTFKDNEAFREWEERRQQYLSDINKSLEPTTPPPENEIGFDHSHGPSHEHGYDHHANPPEPVEQLELNLDSQENSDPKKPGGEQS